ncbi:SWIB/MDM2 domain-containing protein [Aureococcus anophagefferens]|nr:SWIB/MDM2 domain-containing protein [Aureococcus anophagefferens]
MAAVVGVGRANHFRLVKLLWKYIKSTTSRTREQDEIVCDAALKAAFKKDKVTSFGMSKLLSAHMHREHDSFLARAPVVDYAELRLRRGAAAAAEGLLFEGDAIEARCRGGAWYPGRVAFVHDGGGAIDVAYDDGSEARAAGVRRPLRPAPARRSGLAGASAAALAPGAKVEIYWDGDDAFYAGTRALLLESGTPAAPPAAAAAVAPHPLLVAAEAELHGGTAEEEQAAPRGMPHFLGSKDIAGARAASVKYFDQAWGSTHDGEPCPPARYAGWSLAAAVARAERAEAQVAERDETIRGLRDTIHGHERTIRERATVAALEARARAASARPPPRGSGAILDLEAELHDDNAEEQAVGRSLKQLARHLPLFVGSDGVAGAPDGPRRGGGRAKPNRVAFTCTDGDPVLESRHGRAQHVSSGGLVVAESATEADVLVTGPRLQVKTSLAIAVARGVPVVTTAWLKECASRGFAEPRAEHASRDAAFERRHGLDLGVSAPRFEKRYARRRRGRLRAPDKPRYRAAAEAAGAVWIRKAGLEADRELLELSGAAACEAASACACPRGLMFDSDKMMKIRGSQGGEDGWALRACDTCGQNARHERSKFQISYVDGEFAADYLTGSSGVAYRFIDQLPAAEDDDDARSEDEGAALAEEQRTVALPPLPPPPALPAAAPRPLLAAAEDELHGGITEEEQAVPFRVPHFLGSKDVAGARAASVQYFDQAWASTHDGELCPPAHYAGWSVVLTGGAREPTNFVDAAGVTQKRESGMDVIDGLEIVAEEAPSHVRQSFALADAHASTVAELEETIVARDETIVAREATIARHERTIAADAATIDAHEETIAARDEAIAARDETIARLKRRLATTSSRPLRETAGLAAGGGGAEEISTGSNVLRVLDLNDVAGARDLSVQFLDQVYGAAHGGAPCPPAKYAGWSVVLTGVATEPTKFVDGAGFVYRTRNDVARKIGVLAGPLSERGNCRNSMYANMPYGDRRALLLEPGGLGLPASPAAPAAAAAPSPAAAAPSPAAAAPASPPPASPPPARYQGDGLEGGVDIIDGLEIVAEEAPSHARQSFALVDAHASTVAELEETIA